MSHGTGERGVFGSGGFGSGGFGSIGWALGSAIALALVFAASCDNDEVKFDEDDKGKIVGATIED